MASFPGQASTYRLKAIGTSTLALAFKHRMIPHSSILTGTGCGAGSESDKKARLTYKSSLVSANISRNASMRNESY